MRRIPAQGKRWIRGSAVVLAMVGAWLVWTTASIWRHARTDDAQTSDVIVILGAAKYHGKPSPVLRARLEHGLGLFRRGLAPRILTTGGAGGDPLFTEGEVGRDYLMGRGVPPEAIIVEPEAETTAESVAAIGEILHRMDLRSCIVVTDGYHLLRVRRMLEHTGLKVHGSPRPSEAVATAGYLWLCVRQAAGYLLWTMGVVF